MTETDDENQRTFLRFAEVCPDCGSEDISDTHGNAQAIYQRPRYYCYGCGIRFDTPREGEIYDDE